MLFSEEWVFFQEGTLEDPHYLESTQTEMKKRHFYILLKKTLFSDEWVSETAGKRLTRHY